MERCILVERKVRACAIIICLVIGEQIANMPLSQRHDMIEALSPDRSDQPFNMTVLPRGAWRDRPFSDARASVDVSTNSVTTCKPVHAAAETFRPTPAAIAF